MHVGLRTRRLIRRGIASHIAESWSTSQLKRPEGRLQRLLRLPQKLKLSIFDESKVVGGPSTTSPLLPTVRFPSLPASKLSPSLPVIVPDARLAAAYAAR